MPNANERAVFCSKSCRQANYYQRKQEQQKSLSGTDAPDNNTQPEVIPQNETPVSTQPVITPTRNTSRSIDADFVEDQTDWKITDDSKGTTIPTVDFWHTTIKPTTSQPPVPPKPLPPGADIDQIAIHNFLTDKYEKELEQYKWNLPEPEPVKSTQKPVFNIPKANDGWQPVPFAEPEPKRVEPITRTEYYFDYPPELKPLENERSVLELQLKQAQFDHTVFLQVQQTLAKPATVVFGYVVNPKEKDPEKLKKIMRPFSELLLNGCDNRPIVLLSDVGAVERNQHQIKLCNQKIVQLEKSIAALKARLHTISPQLDHALAKKEYTRQVIENEALYNLYLVAYKAWENKRDLYYHAQIMAHENAKQISNPLITTNPKPENNMPPVQQSPPPNEKPAPNKQPYIAPNPTHNHLPDNLIPFKKGNIKKPGKGEIISSMDVDKYAQDVYAFQGRYGQFIGQPPIGFEIVVHGLPGQGKSFFCYMFAHYLASNWGRVLYVASEEGFSQTTALKLRDTKHPNLDVSNSGDAETIFQTVKKDQYKFIFFDSLKHLKINYDLYLELRGFYENESFVSVQQSTKGKEMAGEQSLKHEIDVEIIVENGYAYTGKNRALNGRTGRVFDVFPEEGRTFSDPEIEVI
ncbi:MAG: hypothetical protein U1O81_07860 [Planktothrix rubescens PR223]